MQSTNTRIFKMSRHSSQARHKRSRIKEVHFLLGMKVHSGLKNQITNSDFDIFNFRILVGSLCHRHYYHHGDRIIVALFTIMDSPYRTCPTPWATLCDSRSFHRDRRCSGSTLRNHDESHEAPPKTGTGSHNGRCATSYAITAVYE
jgi:hypothetical protein